MGWKMIPEYQLKDTILQIKDICLNYGDKTILKNVNATVRDIVRPGCTTGQIVGFLGPSGIGKTQLFRIIAGLNKPTSGEVLINAQATPVRAGQVGVVAQNYPLFEHRSIFSNLLISAMQKETDEKAAKDKIWGLLDQFDLRERAMLYPAQLSGGQRQRTAIVQQILCSEHFLLMDEPFSGLDLIALKKVSRLITQVANMDELNTIIVVTHDVTAAASVADHLWLMGRDHDEAGNVIPGARIVKTYDLIEEDLCWHPDIIVEPRFMQFVAGVKTEFERL
jgi:ABC-type nitrate/sulfonate/bicarbonate transport system ATPase subunit